MTLPADKPAPPVTLTDPDMMSQDISKPLGQWFASRLSAREDVRRAVTLPADVARCVGHHEGQYELLREECRDCLRRADRPALQRVFWRFESPPALVDGKCPMRLEAR